MDNGFISGLYYLSIINILDDMGVSRDVAFGVSGLKLSDVNHPKARIHMAAVKAVFDHAATALDEPNIGLQVGYRFRVHTFTETGSVLALCSTLAEAVQINAMYQPLTETVGVCSLGRRDGDSFIDWQEVFENHEEYRHLTELVFAGYATTTNWLSWGFEPGVDAVFFKHSQPKSSEGYETVFGKNVHFGAERNALRFNRDVVDRALPTSNPEKLAYVRHRLDSLLSRIEQKSGIRERVSLIILDGIKEQQVGFDFVAREIGMSPRNLRRMLKDEGYSYRDILANVRQSLCHSYVREGRSYTEIAQLLAYNDQSAFTRAFKKWYGVSPSDYEPEYISL